jgi:hypothetical protein
MDIYFNPDGSFACLYSEELPLAKLGKLSIKRFTTVEPVEDSPVPMWQVRTNNGEMLYENPSRINCLAWEEEYFRKEMEK